MFNQHKITKNSADAETTELMDQDLEQVAGGARKWAIGPDDISGISDKPDGISEMPGNLDGTSEPTSRPDGISGRVVGAWL